MGAVLPLLLLAMPVLLAALKGGWQIQKSALQAHQVQRAVDRAAYSGAGFVADGLNQIALHNQAIVGAHLLQGHLVSQLSWTQYVMRLTQRGGVALAVALPGVGTALAKGASSAYEFQKAQMPLWTAAMSAAGATHQALAWAEVVKLASGLDAVIRNTGGGQVSQWLLDPQSVAQIKTKSQQSTVLSQSMSNQPWLTNRGWSSNLLWVLKMEKSGRTQASGDQWVASDRLTMKVRGWFKWKKITLASGAANSRSYGYLGGGNLVALDRDQIWLVTRTDREHATGWALPRRQPNLNGALMWPVWDAQLGALPYLNGWSG